MYSTSPNGIKDKPLWTKQQILSRVSQEQIFAHYLGIDPNKVGREKFCSPLRKDHSPTCNYSWHNGTVYFRDWSDSRPKDCFQIVQDLYFTGFTESLRIIAEDLNLDGRQNGREKPEKREQRFRNSEKSKIKVKTQPLTKLDKTYLQSYHIPLKIAKYYKVYSVKYYWINGQMRGSYSKRNPCLGYYFGVSSNGDQRWKLYFYRSRGKWRFISNTNRINGWVQIPKTAEKLIITKSMKDVMCLARFSIPAIAMQAENQLPYDYIIDELKERFDQIYTLYDFDRTGVTYANKIRKMYNIPACFLTNGRWGTMDYRHKDLSDFLQANGVDETAKLLEHFNFL